MKELNMNYIMKLGDTQFNQFTYSLDINSKTLNHMFNWEKGI